MPAGYRLNSFVTTTLTAKVRKGTSIIFHKQSRITCNSLQVKKKKLHYVDTKSRLIYLAFLSTLPKWDFITLMDIFA